MPDTALPLSRTYRYWLIGVFLLGLIVRLTYLSEISASPLFQVPSVDAQGHVEWARRILDGQWSDSKPFFRAPLYPFFLASVLQLTGDSLIGVRVVQHLIGALSCVLVVLLADRFLERRLALMAGVGCALCGPIIFYENQLLLPVLELFLFLTSLLSMLTTFERPSFGRWCITGLLIGLASITRPNFVLLIPVVTVFLFAALSGLLAWYRRLWYWLALIGGSLIPILPVTLHNYFVSGEWVLISTQGGINFYVGNSPYSDGKTAFALGQSMAHVGQFVDNVYADSVKIAQQQSGAALSDAAVSRYWFDKVLDYWRDSTIAAIKLTLRKFYYFINGFEIESNRSMYLDRDYSTLFSMLTLSGWIAFPLGIIWPLAIVGMCVPTRCPLYSRIVLSSLLVYSGSIVAFFVTARFRIPVVPLLMIFAMQGGRAIYDSIRKAQIRRLAWMMPGWVILTVICNSNRWGVRDVDHARQKSILAYSYLQLNDLDQAIQLYRQSIAIDPTSFFEHYNLAGCLREKGLLDEAVASFQMAADLAPRNADVFNSLGLTLIMQERFEQAISVLEKAISLDPRSAMVYHNLGMALMPLGKMADAVHSFEQAIALEHQLDRNHFLIGMCYVHQHQMELAIQNFEAALAHNPSFAEAHYQLARIFDVQNESDLAWQHLQEARRLGITPDSDWAEKLHMKMDRNPSDGSVPANP